MNLDNERKAFEEWFCKNNTGLKPSELIKFRTNNGYSFKDSIKINCMWESWLASANRQGYKLVPLEPTKEMLNLGYRVKHEKIIDLGRVYKAMIGACDE